MNLEPDRHLNCKCCSQLNDIRGSLQSSSLDVSQILNLVETLAGSFRTACYCENGCTQSTYYTQLLIQPLMRLLDFLDVLRMATLSHHSGSASYTSSRTGKSPEDFCVTGHQQIARLNRFPLDELEKKLLAQELLRGSLVAINSIAKEVHHRLMQARSLPPSLEDSGAAYSSIAQTQQHMCNLYDEFLSRTYSALAMCSGD
ncbi:hypothetical protein BO71DRAFT_401785 [Aspergillus ellipticus CBS 707.79]|uniref:Aflatoxin regulatory protein domain-containing protein n=1 Tax=Aspergillus ellipticus CBS 707.79 TaxID=1448320 RepID=A0A319D1K6_9EURO|nr:hypothetical protein BO71DRAFT_401785 [Aspergillus ellipticus CBS 707.79]